MKLTVSRLLVFVLMLQLTTGIRGNQKDRQLRGAWGYVDKGGKVVIPPQFDVAEPFVNGLARVEIQKKWRYIDRTGKQVGNAQYDEASDFSENLAAVKQNGSWGYIDNTGSVVIAPTFTSSSRFSDGLAAVQVGDAWGYTDKAGKFSIRPQFTLADDFSEGLAAVFVCKGWNAEGAASVPASESCAWGFINKNVEFVIKPSYRFARSFSEGLAVVCDSAVNCGFIDKTGSAVIPLEFHCDPLYDMGDFHEGLAMVSGIGGTPTLEGVKNTAGGYIDKRGKWVVRSRNQHWDKEFSEGFARIGKLDGHKWSYGYIDLSGNLRIRPQFEEAGSFSEGLAPAGFGENCGYIDKTGKFVIKPQFHKCTEFHDGLAPISMVLTQ